MLVCVTASGLLNTLAAPPVVTVSGTKPILLGWPTNFPSFALQTKTNAGASVAWEICALRPVLIGTNYVVTSTFTESSVFYRLSNWPQLACRYNLQRVGLAMRTWELDYDGRFPFHTPTNWGGTMELRAIGSDGFDTNGFLHFMALSNYMSAVAWLVCPGDVVREAATSFASLRPENVTYRLRTGDTVTDRNPGEVLAVCPIDGNTLFCDGSVTNGIKY
jgi:prepilin-type processing-associated H-X9-DG protein